jgi:cytochrome oxidase Cu insertion factor (SCO1/SenC/PrrC family)
MMRPRGERQGRRGLTAALFLLAASFAGPALAHGESPAFDFPAPRPGSYELAVLDDAPDGQVIGADGAAHRLRAAIQGRIALISFIYTQCADASGCPLATAALAEVADAAEKDRQLAANLRLVSLSFDPKHDTPAAIAAYQQAHNPPRAKGAAADWRFFTTAAPDKIAPILDGFGQYIVPEFDAEGRATGQFMHVLKVFLVDRRGRVRNIYGVSFLDPRLVLADIKTLLLEEKQRARK